MVEKMWYRVESSHLTTSEVAKNWTEHSKNSKLNEVNSKLSSAKSNEAKELKDLISKREYKDFQKKIWMKWYDLDWKIWPRTLATFSNYLNKIEWTNDTIHRTNEELHNLRDDINGNNSDGPYKDYVHRPEYQELTDNARIHKNAKEYLSKHESLSESAYNQLFSWKEQLQQWQIWNCYMVTALIELSNTQYFDTLARTSISRVQFKDDGSMWYNIRIPLWEPNGRDILIKDSELNTAKIRWNIGYKLLEIAFVKSKRRNDTEWNRYSPVTLWEYQSIAWWSIEWALTTFLGKNNIWFSNFGTYPIWKSWQPLSAASQSQKTEMTNYLKNFNWSIWNKFTCLATAPSPQWDRESFNVWWNTFRKNHAYALESVEKDSNWNISYVNVKNPWNDKFQAWGAASRITLNEFFNTFSYMWAWKIKTNTFLDDKWGAWA